MAQIAILGDQCLRCGQFELSVAAMSGYVEYTSVDSGQYGAQDSTWSLK